MAFIATANRVSLSCRLVHPNAQNSNSCPSRDGIQPLDDVAKLKDLLRQERLIYSMRADVCCIVAESYHDMLLGDASRAASYEHENRQEALGLARKVLDLDIACTGYKSPEVAKTLIFIRRLKG